MSHNAAPVSNDSNFFCVYVIEMVVKFSMPGTLLPIAVKSLVTAHA